MYLVALEEDGLLRVGRHASPAYSPNGADWYVWDARLGPFPLERVVGLYRGMAEARDDWERALKEADAHGDGRDLLHPCPEGPLTFRLVAKYPPLGTPLWGWSASFGPADEPTLDFMRRRPAFFFRLSRRIASLGQRRGHGGPAQVLPELAELVVDACMRKWRDAVRVRVEVRP